MMATCNECLYQPICNTYASFGVTDLPASDTSPCELFKNKADVVEAVRCKDCGFNVSNMKKDPLDITDYSGDDIVCSYFMTDGMHPNDYCSRGKSQEEGET